MTRNIVLASLICSMLSLHACGGGGGGGGDDSGTDADAPGDVSADQPVDSAGDPDDDGVTPACDIDAAAPPWPDWVPDWPGSGLNATGNTTFRVLDAGASVTDLAVEDVSATSAVITWTTPGEADSSIAWGTTPETCPTGYQRTGGRLLHRMLAAPLEPGTTYHVVVRSRDASSEDFGLIEVTTPAHAAATELTGCQEITASGSYRLTADVTADCTCFHVTAPDVHLDLGWHTVTYAATETGEQCHGVFLHDDTNTAARGIIVQGSAGGSLYSHALYARGGDGQTFEQLWVRVHTSDAFGMRTMYTSTTTARDLLIVSEVRDVTDRHYPGNHGIALGLSPSDATGDIHDCILFGVPHWGLTMGANEEERLTSPPDHGPTRFVYNNHVFADMHATNGYAISVAANHMEVHHNEIRPLHNGRAVHYTMSNASIHHNIIEAVELIEGDPADGFAYYSDTSDTHSPHDPSVCTWVVAHGIRVESGNLGEISHNEVYSYTLPDVSFGCTALNITTPESGGAGANEVHHNQFTAYQASGSITCSGGLPTTAGWVRGGTPDTPNDLHDNFFRSTHETLFIEDPAMATSTDDTLESI
ncbi:MAG: fibronectin type III domain-containing protein [Deltaproteobacteria bacterium]|nr:fibronectin type III domain-containing protein [Deltaproteobacteria bacterium]